MNSVTFSHAVWALSHDEEAIFNGEQGVAKFDPQQGLSLEIPMGCLLDYQPENGIRSIGGDPLTASAVYGFCQNGDRITLGEVSTPGPGFAAPGTQREDLRAEYALVCRKDFIEPDAHVSKMKLQIAGLWCWAGAPYGKIISELGDDNQPGWRKTTGIWSIEDLAETTLYEDDVINIIIEPSYSFRGGSLPLREFSVKRGASLLVVMKEELDSNLAIEKWLVPIWDFLTICMGIRGSIGKVTFTRSDGVQFDYYRPFVSGVDEPDDKQLERMPLKLKVLKSNGTQNVLEKWFGLEGDARRGTKVLLGTIGQKNLYSLSLYFVALSGSFEALSRSGEKKIDIQKERYSKIVDVVEGCLDDSDDRAWIRRKLNNCPPARYYAEKLMEKLGAFAAYVVPDEARFLKDLRICRNAYIHQTEDLEKEGKVLEGEDLFAHARALQVLCYGAVLLQLGLTDSQILQIFKNTRYCWYQIDEARRMYAIKDN